MYFLQHGQDATYYVMAPLLESLQSHYRLQTHALNGSAPFAEAKLVRFKKMKEKKKIKILAAKSLACAFQEDEREKEDKDFGSEISGNVGGRK
jgi:hypothetical protein